MSDTKAYDRIQEGADWAPRDAHCMPTPGQAWAELLAMDPKVRLDRLAALIDASEKASACFLHNHEARLAYAEPELANVRDTLRRRTDSHTALIADRLACPNCSTLTPAEQ